MYCGPRLKRPCEADGVRPFKIAWSYATVDVTRTLVDE
jgi:hypothetical protein